MAILSWAAHDLHLAIVCSRKRATIILELDNGLRRLSCHVMDSILVTQPIRTLHGIVHVPPPVVFVHAKRTSLASRAPWYG